MKKLIYLLFIIPFTSCSASFQGGGWFIPVGLMIAGLYTLGRFFFGYNPFSKEVFIKRQKGTLLYACIFIVASIIVYFIMKGDK